MKAISINIPKPCHEDWNKMTPNEKGAHCAVCAKTVIDFSNKTDKEIIEVFEKKAEEKVCGRFSTTQLSRPVVEFSEPTSTNRLLKFVCALFLVFGIRLFSGVEANAQTVKGEVRPKLMGKVAYRPIEQPITTKKDTTKKTIEMPPEKCLVSMGDVAVESIMTGQVMVSEVLQPAANAPDTAIAEIETTIVDNVIAEQTNLTPDTTVKIIETPVLIDPEEFFSEPMMMGLIIVDVVPPNVEEPIITDTVAIKESIIEETIINPEKELTIVSSPNPSVGEIMLSYELKETSFVQIDLFDVTGKLAKTLNANTKQYAGQYNVSYNISDLPDGIYISNIIAGDKKTSTRVILAR